MCLKIIDTTGDIFDAYSNGVFEIEKWKQYIGRIVPALGEVCIQDMKASIDTGAVEFEKDYLPILNRVMEEPEKLAKLQENFRSVTENLEDGILRQFGKTPDVDILLYLGLCNGAGWVETIGEQVFCLLGIEKILELAWYDVSSLYGLIYHELGHVYQNQYGVLERSFESGRQQFLWQLFTEGIAMYFEQTLLGDREYYHQDKNGWKAWCDEHIKQIARDFARELDGMTFENQRYFGDWVSYEGKPDVGYYLGTRFVQYICEQHDFEKILLYDIDQVEELFCRYKNKLGV